MLHAYPPTHPLLLLLPFRNRSLTLLSIREPIASPGNDASLSTVPPNAFPSSPDPGPACLPACLPTALPPFSLPSSSSSCSVSDIKTDTQRERERGRGEGNRENWLVCHVNKFHLRGRGEFYGIFPRLSRCDMHRREGGGGGDIRSPMSINGVAALFPPLFLINDRAGF